MPAQTKPIPRPRMLQSPTKSPFGAVKPVTSGGNFGGNPKNQPIEILRKSVI